MSKINKIFANYAEHGIRLGKGKRKWPGRVYFLYLQFYDRRIFEISDHFIKVIFPFYTSADEENIASGDNNGDKNKVLLLLEKEPDITAKKMGERIGLSTRKINRIIKELRESEASEDFRDG